MLLEFAFMSIRVKGTYWEDEKVGVPRKFALACSVWLSLIGLAGQCLGHTIHYTVEPKGITIRVFYAADDPASYSEYEIFGPGDNEPYQVGRTDRRGCLSLFPDRPGVWKIKVLGESTHGFHGVNLELKVDQALQAESFSRPLLATHTRLITGLSLIFGIFGIYAYWRSRKARRGQDSQGRGRT